MTGAALLMQGLRASEGVLAGSSSPERIGESVGVGRVRLTAEHARMLDQASRGAIDGARDAPGFLDMMER